MSTSTPREKHDHGPLKFPKGFLWGAGTSAYQVEGGNIHSDWWEWEKHRSPQFHSGPAADQYHLYKEDFDLAKSLNHNAHRLSIEWSRIEPREGEFDSHEIEHYRQVLKSLQDRGMKVMLTLWHFTLPKWVAEQGGWENGRTVGFFERFVKRVAADLAPYVDFWITLNEPGVYTYQTYIERVWPHAKKSLWGAVKTTFNLAKAHRRIYKFLHQLWPHKPVGVANNIESFEPYHKHSLIEQISVVVTDLVSNHLFYFLTGKTHDFLGINYYFHLRFKHRRGILPEIVDASRQSRDISDLGWEVYPEGIFDVLADLSDDLPIYITECGIASTNDDRRNRFLIMYLGEVYRAIQAGVKVKGFFYWSLIDNFEWHLGFEPRFGLIEVDYSTQQRKIRPSALIFGEIIKHNAIPHDLLKLLGHGIRVEKVLKEKIEE